MKSHSHPDAERSPLGGAIRVTHRRWLPVRLDSAPDALPWTATAASQRREDARC